MGHVAAQNHMTKTIKIIFHCCQNLYEYNQQKASNMEKNKDILIYLFIKYLVIKFKVEIFSIRYRNCHFMKI